MTGFARWEMRQELSLLWQQCFGDPKGFPDFFLSHLFSPRDCLVTTAKERVVSAVYLLPAKILSDGKTVPAHYIFAAATMPGFRSRGLMSSLLKRAAEEGERRGDCYSAVLPADEGLYRFYAAAGYEDFFQVRRVKLSAAELSKTASLDSPPNGCQPDWAGWNRCRTKLLAGNSGSLLWNDRMFCGAVSMSLVYGDQFVCAEGLSYALCRRGKTQCDVLEAAADQHAFPSLAAAVLKEAPAEHYCFRFPIGCSFFPGKGTVERFGMLKGLGGRATGDVKPYHPYLGLGMD